MANGIFNGSKTIYNSRLLNRMSANQDFTPLLNTTLNEKFNIGVDYVNDPSVYPAINLLTIGSGYVDAIVSANRLNLKTSPHKPTDAALFKHTPFYLRKLDEIGTYPPSSKLRLKKTINVNGDEYLAYYGYFLNDYETSDDVIMYSNIDQEYVNITKVDLEALDVLNPEINMAIDMGNNLTDKNFVTDPMKMILFLTREELIEIDHAMEILEEPDNVHRVTEIGLCSSKSTTLNGGDEQVLTQISYFVDCIIDLKSALVDGYTSLTFELGSSSILELK